MTDDSSASNRALIRKVGSPVLNGSRRATHPVYRSLMRSDWDSRKRAVDALATRIGTVTGVTLATPWLSREGDRLRVYLSFGAPPAGPAPRWHLTPYYLDARFGDVRCNDRAMPDDHRDRIGASVLGAVVAAWWSWARDTISEPW